MENKELRNDLGTAYRALESHIEEIKKRKADIASLEAENKKDLESLTLLDEKVDELKKELEN